jgi:hypothetical protein
MDDKQSRERSPISSQMDPADTSRNNSNVIQFNFQSKRFRSLDQILYPSEIEAKHRSLPENATLLSKHSDVSEDVFESDKDGKLQSITNIQTFEVKKIAEEDKWSIEDTNLGTLLLAPSQNSKSSPAALNRLEFDNKVILQSQSEQEKHDSFQLRTKVSDGAGCTRCPF